MKVAALQMVSSPSLAQNLAQAQALLRQAAQQGAELAVLPEYFCLLGRRDTDKLALQEHYGHGPIQQFLADAARQLGLWIVGGTLPLRTQDPADSAPPHETVSAGASDGTHATPSVPSRVYNSTLVFDPQGQCRARYDKMHLFCFDHGGERYDEARTLRPGTQPTLFELPARDGHTWRIGLSVCYDLRFPELYRHYAALGADLLLVPAAFTHTTGQAHWELLLRARAVENLAFVLAAAQGGLHDNGRRTWGHSLVADPWGTVLQQHPQGEAVVLAELDAAQLAAYRLQLPALTHRVL
jgi:nitrilase